VAGVLLTGIANVLFIRGVVSFWLLPWGQWLLLKFVLVMVMVVVALVNRYVLVPRMRQRSPRVSVWFIWMTKFELGTGAVVLAVVSLFATLEPF
jgi:putative copper resistance protein D